MGKAVSKEKAGQPAGGEGGADVQKTGVEIEVPFDQYSFPFENVVFGGGPLTSLAYIGAVRVSESVVVGGGRTTAVVGRGDVISA